MILSLKGLDDAARRINVQITGLIERGRKLLEEEAQAVKDEIVSEFTGKNASLAAHVRIEFDNKGIVIRLPHIIGNDHKGRPIRSVRKEHNPYWPEFEVQPFQKVLERRGYTEIDPVGPLEPSHGTAPNIRIKAKLPNELLRRIAGG